MSLYKFTIIFFVLSNISLKSQNYNSLKIAFNSDEILKETNLKYKVSQNYYAFEKFRKVQKKNNSQLFINEKNVDIPGIGGRVRAILVDRQNDIKLAAPSGGGLWRFETDGSSFTPLADFAPFILVTDIAQNPFNSDEILITTGDEYHGLKGTGLFISHDKGISFDPLLNTNPDTNSDFWYTRYVKYHPERLDEIYVVANQYLLKSIDHGVKWERVFSANQRIKSIDFNHQGAILISVYRYGLYMSPSGNVNTFNQITHTIPFGDNTIDNCIVSAQDGNRSIVYSSFAEVDQNSLCGMVSKVYKSTDGGNSWSMMGEADYCVRSTGFVYCFAVHPTDPNILMGGSIGFGYSLDGGQNWTRTRGMEVDFHSISFDTSDPNSCFIGYDQGIGKISLDQTAPYYVWDGNQYIIEQHLLQEEIGKKIGFNTSQIYYGDYYPAEFGDDLVFGQQDGGSFAHSGSIDTRIFVGDGGAIFVNRQDPNKIIGCTQYGVLYKTDSGLNPNFRNFTRDTRFYNNHSNFITEFVVNDLNGDQVYFSTNSAILRSLDFGDTFNPIHSFSQLTSIKMAISSESDPTVYITGIQTSNYSTTLTRIENASSSALVTEKVGFFNINERIDRITCDPNDPKVVYATTFAGDILKIVFDGNTVTKASIRGNATGIVFNIVLALNEKDILAAGTNAGLLYSTDGGLNWTLSDNIPYCQIRDLKYRGEDQKLFVFTHGRGAWTTSLNQINCPQDFTSMNRLTGLQDIDAVFSTYGSIESEQIIDRNVDYNSGGYIEFLEEFEVRLGRQFRAFLGGCPQ